MQKYGIEKFHIEKVEECPLEILSDREKYWIEFFSSYKNGYNATIGGDGKQLYNYDEIIKGFLSGKLVYELAEEFECCQDTIHAALNLANINSKTNANKKLEKGIIAKDSNGNVLKIFNSRIEAVKWLQDNNYVSDSVNRDNVIAAIGRAANGKRKTAYKLIWENI